MLNVEDELITRLSGGKQILGCKFPLLDMPVVSMCFLSDHRNVAWRVGLTIMVGSKTDG
jgi:hypothetical protein